MPQGTYMVRGPLLLAIAWVAVQCIVPTYVGAYVIGNWWNDGDNIVMDDVFLPATTWSAPAQFQLSEWNEVDTTDNSHPFRINLSPEFSFGADDGDNTMGFLGEAGLNSEYGLSYAEALAWAVCWTGVSGRIDECDMMLNPALAWQLVPDANNFFQSTVLHEAGHIRGLNHYDGYLSIQNSGTDKILRGEVLYMDDKVAVRQHASHVPESDMVIYNKFHNGSVPLWMTVSPTTARVGETINFNNITVENRGTTAFGALRFGIYFSPNSIISTGDQLLNTGSFGAFGTFVFSTFDWSAGVPFVSDCGTYYFGAIIDDNNIYGERFEGNNATVFVNGTPTPQAFSILLERDAQEPNDSFAAPRTIFLPFSSGNLTIDQDAEHDYYRFTLSQLSRVNIALAFTHAAGDIDMELRNSSNVVLQSSTGTGNSESIVSDLAAGTYYIHTYGYSSAAGSCNRYTMTATAMPLIPDMNMLPSSWNYGNITVGSRSNKVFIVQNLGSGTLNVTSTSLVGAGSAHFSIISGGGAFSLAPTATQTVTVRFAPTSSGAKSATLRFASNDPDENPQNAALSGIGTDASDLIVSSLVVPAVRGAGDTIVVADTTTSLGGAAAASTTRFFLSTDNLFNAGDTSLGSRAIPALSAEGSSAGTTSVIIPAGTAVGKYFVIARADANGVITETHEGNNNTAKPIWIGPDLVVLNLTGPRSAVAGSTITVSDTTRNLGGDPVAATKTRYFLSTDDVQQPGDVVLGTRSVPGLAAKTSNSGSISVTIPAATAPGAYFLIAKADAGRVVDESREPNNTKSRPITISSRALLTIGAHQ